MATPILAIILVAPPLLLSIILHEIAHGWVAYRLGDDTAVRAGRLTLNPIPHIDPFGSVILPLLLAVTGLPIFGWAKPVPVHFGRLRRPKRDMVFVALAGPATNLALAVICVWLAHQLLLHDLRAAAQVPIVGMQINVALAVFNMLPILPLDGGRVLFGLLPLPVARAFGRLEPYGMLIVVGLLYTGVVGSLIGPVTRLLVHVLVRG
ncbi:site-2 protease family protein [bacterium]|nr:site-2 protease family protein [bacterium]